MKKHKYIKEKIQFNYYTQSTKYYHLTESSGYPSAEYEFIYSGKKGTGLVIPEVRTDSANLVQGTD